VIALTKLVRIRGSALLGILVIALVLAVLGTTLMVAMGGESRSSARNVSSAQALGLADSGLEHVYATLLDDELKPDEVEDAFAGGVSLSDWEEVQGYTTVTVELSAPRTATLTSTGHVDSPEYSRTIQMEVKYSPPPMFEYLLGAFGDTSSISLVGSATIDGNIHSNGTGTGPPAGYAISVSGTKLAVTEDSYATAVGTVRDHPSQPAFGGNAISGAPKVEPEADIDLWRNLAQEDGQYYSGDFTLNGGTHQIGGVVFVTGSISFGGNVVVRGNALFVSEFGNISASGGADIEGSLYACVGNISLGGTNQSAKINGSVIAECGNISAGGNVDLTYPTEFPDEEWAMFRWRRGSWRETGW